MTLTCTIYCVLLLKCIQKSQRVEVEHRGFVSFWSQTPHGPSYTSFHPPSVCVPFSVGIIKEQLVAGRIPWSVSVAI